MFEGNFPCGMRRKLLIHLITLAASSPLCWAGLHKKTKTHAMCTSSTVEQPRFCSREVQGSRQASPFQSTRLWLNIPRLRVRVPCFRALSPLLVVVGASETGTEAQYNTTSPQIILLGFFSRFPFPSVHLLLHLFESVIIPFLFATIL